MRSYGKKYIRDKVRAATEQKVESRDAVLWDILEGQRKCRVKIEGSDTYVIADYPQNIYATPTWMKPGNAVRVIHRGGVRGHIEVAASGITRPNTSPDPVTPVDAIISGCNVKAAGGMFVIVTSGEVRLSGTTYDTLDILMTASSALIMGLKYAVMGQVAAAFELTAPSAGTYRIDLIVIGSDLIIDRVAGTPAATPVQPDTPSGHLLLGTVLVPPGCTEIMQSYINRTFTAPGASSIEAVIADDELAWAELSTTITATVYDQYGNAIALGSGYGWYVTCEIINGNGTISSSEEGSSTTIIGQHTDTAGTSAIVRYTRDQLGTDESPSFELRMETAGGYLSAMANITLLDADGNVM